MLKMQILMDEEKILREDKYDLNKISATLDNLFIYQLGLKKGSDGFYLESGRSSDYAHFGKAMITLGKQSWFMNNVDTWLFFSSDDSDDSNDFVIEDFKQFCLEKYQIGA